MLRSLKSVTKLANRLQVQMKSHKFDLLDPIYIIRYLRAFVMAWDMNKIPKEAALLSAPLFTKLPATSTLNTRRALCLKSHKR